MREIGNKIDNLNESINKLFTSFQDNLLRYFRSQKSEKEKEKEKSYVKKDFNKSKDKELSSSFNQNLEIPSNNSNGKEILPHSKEKDGNFVKSNK